MTVHHDNRDFSILANYQPKNVESLNIQTQLFGRSEGVCRLQCLFFVYLCSPLSPLARMAFDLPQNIYPSLPAGQ